MEPAQSAARNRKSEASADYTSRLSDTIVPSTSKGLYRLAIEYGARIQYQGGSVPPNERNESVAPEMTRCNATRGGDGEDPLQSLDKQAAYPIFSQRRAQTIGCLADDRPTATTVASDSHELHQPEMMTQVATRRRKC